jgi:Protein of unknown function (DUF3102)
MAKLSNEQMMAKAAELAPKISEAYTKAVEASQASLAHAIDAGEMLRQAKEYVGHGNWDIWLRDNCPEISDRTARLYMRLAKNADKLDIQNGNAVADLSIRGAAKMLAKPKAEGGKKGPSPLERQLGKLAADELYELLMKLFDTDYLDTLAEHLTAPDEPATPVPPEELKPQVTRRLQN